MPHADKQRGDCSNENNPNKRFLALFLLWAGHSQATTITCVASTSWPAKAEVFTLNGIISVGEDTPVGTVVYRAQLWANNMGLDCRASADESIVGTTIYLPTRVEAISTPTSVVPGVTAPSTSEVVYETNVPGIGVSVTAAGKMPYVWQTAFSDLNMRLVEEETMGLLLVDLKSN